MSLPLISLTRGWPNDPRELGRVLEDLNFWVRKGRDRVHSLNQKFHNQIGAANKQSTQSVNPLSATDSGGGFAQISIASHDIQYADFTISYNSGSISGLLNSTLYYIYFDDPEFDGGAVTYFETTSPLNITAELGRVYVGKITTPAGGGGGTSGGYGGGGGGNGFPLP